MYYYKLLYELSFLDFNDYMTITMVIMNKKDDINAAKIIMRAEHN